MRILIADDQPKVRFALRVLLERQPGLKVIGEAVDATDLLTQTETNPLLALRQARPGLLVVVLSCRPEARRQALADGADAFVSKADPPEKLLVAIDHCRRQ
jgi:DNA-binding NarL/FixJ family response regulator